MPKPKAPPLDPAKELAEQSRQLADLRERYARLEQVLKEYLPEYAELVREPTKREYYKRLTHPDPEKMYGWVHVTLNPIYEVLEKNNVSPSVRSEVVATVQAVLAKLVIEGKHGVQIPCDPRSFDLDRAFERSGRQLAKEYRPCEICGEDRITHDCHIIPREKAGPDHPDNLLSLCPLHHHLFDHCRLNQAEWGIIETILSQKMAAAQVYAHDYLLREHQRFWMQSVEVRG